jgi:hypothetical protein
MLRPLPKLRRHDAYFFLNVMYLFIYPEVIFSLGQMGRSIYYYYL